MKKLLAALVLLASCAASPGDLAWKFHADDWRQLNASREARGLPTLTWHEYVGHNPDGTPTEYGRRGVWGMHYTDNSPYHSLSYRITQR